MDATTPVAEAGSPPAVDRVVAVVLLVALGLVAPIVTFLALMFSMVSDGCMGETSCNGDQIGQGIAIAGLAPWIALIGGVVMVVKRVRQRRRVWWVPLVAALLGAGLFVVGAIIAATAVA